MCFLYQAMKGHSHADKTKNMRHFSMTEALDLKFPE